MIREVLGKFGRGMSDPELGAALAGVLRPRLRSGLRAVLPRGRVACQPMHFWASRFSVLEQLDAEKDYAEWRELAQQAASAAKAARHGLALELSRDVWPWTAPIDPVELAITIGAGEAVAAMHYTVAPPQPAVEWIWPLDVACFDDAASNRLRDELAGLELARFVTPIRALGATAPIELLVIPASLPDALRTALARSGLPRVQAVLVLGGIAGMRAAIDAAETLRVAANADAVCIAAVPPRRHREFLDAMLAELSHDFDLDVAFAAACRSERLAPPLLIASQGAFARAHLSQWTHHVATRLDRISPISLPDLPRLNLTASPSHQVALHLLRRMPELRFDHEGNEATDIADLGKILRHAKPALEKRERRVQAELYEGEGAEAQQVTQAPLARGRSYALGIWIGPPTGQDLVAPRPFPDDELPDSASGHKLVVVFTAPGILQAPQVQKVHLPNTGESERARFTFTIDEATRVQQLEARITVLHENRVVQTMLLVASIGVGEPVPLELAIESVLRRDLDGVVGRRRFDAAMLFNELAGARSMSVFAGERASLVAIDGGEVANAVQAVAALLEDVTNQPKKYGPPPTKATTELLSDLARRGSLLRQALFEMPEVRDELAEARRIQIIAAKPEAVLPIEACYDPPAPAADATMCPNWEQALSQEQPACSASCPADKRSVVCPVGFWATSRVIERHVYDKKNAKQLGANDFALQSEPTSRQRLPILQGGICAAAAAARAEDPSSVNQAFTTFAATTPPASEVSDWKGWKAEIAGRQPALLLLLSHSDSAHGLSTLVIGAKDAALVTELDQRFVGRGAGPGPIVILLGCSTAVPKPVYESFVTQFRRGGAAVVIGTLCEILGRHAAPIAKALVEQLALAAKESEGAPLGECMTRLRRQLLAQGIPIVLTVIAFGDADWII